MSPAPKIQLRVVLDTNIYISAFTQAAGVASSIWEHAVKRRFDLLLSPAIASEIAQVLRTYFAWEEKSVRSQIKLIAKSAEIILPTVTLNIVTDDPSDNRILECAIEGKADLIVSGDRHLRKLKVVEGIAVIRPADFLRTLGK